LAFLEKRFGMDATGFSPWQIYAFRRQAFLFRRQQDGPWFQRDSFVRCGLPFMRIVAGFLKPTTVFIQRFGNRASRNCIDLSMKQIAELCTNGSLHISKITGENRIIDAPGYVVIRTGGLDLGIGLIMEDERLLCRFPKSIRQALSR